MLDIDRAWDSSDRIAVAFWQQRILQDYLDRYFYHRTHRTVADYAPTLRRFKHVIRFYDRAMMEAWHLALSDLAPHFML